MNQKQNLSVGGIIGYPIEHSLSPRIHSFSAKHLNINCSYSTYEKNVAANYNWQTFLDEQLLKNTFGFNISAPYKKKFAMLFPAQPLKSVNTIYRRGGLWSATSTDAQGFFNSLKHINETIEGFEKIIFLGNGDVVDAFLYELNKLKHTAIISILSRNHTNMSYTKLNIGYGELTQGALSSELRASHNTKTLTIQATSAPLFGDELNYLIPALESINGVFIELNYKHHSALYKTLNSQKYINKGVKIQDGLSMLIEQARISQQKWWNTSIDYTTLLNHLTQSP